MLHGEAIAALRGWEARFPVLTWKVHGLHVWPLVRLHLGAHLLRAGHPSRTKPADDPLRRGWRSLAAAAARLRHGASAIRVVRPVDAVFLGRPANRQPVAGVWYERFFDPIADILDAQGLTSLHLEHRQSGTDYLLPRRRPSLVVTGAVSRREFLARFPPAGDEALDGFDEFERRVAEVLPALPVSRVWVRRRARAVELVARYFDGLLQRTTPRIAFCTVYYTVVGMAWCLAARRRGIPSVDVQHGVTLGNPAYAGWSRFPDGGYPTLPSRFWCWSEADAAPVGAWPVPAQTAHRAVVGGHPQVAFWRSGHPLADGLRARIPSRGSASCVILVTLTWSSGFSDLLQGVLREAPADWQWWVRLHPLMGRERGAIRAWCARQLPGKAHVDQPSELPLPLLLDAADVHLTHNSTVVQEAARQGIPSVLIDRRSLDVYTDELRSGWAVFADEVPAILPALASQYHRRRSLSRASPYPSWTDMTTAVRDLLASQAPCPSTAPAASCPTPARV